MAVSSNTKVLQDFYAKKATPKPASTGVVPPMMQPPKPPNPVPPMAAGQALGAANGLTGGPKPLSALPQPSTPQASTQTPSGGYIPNAATNTTGQAPTTGYGAGGVYGQTAGLGQAYKDNAAYIATDAGKQSEIARTQSVIAERKRQGLDTSLQEKYLTNQLGYVPPSNEVQAQGVPGPSMPDATMNMRSDAELQAMSGDQNAIDRAALVNAGETNKTSLKNNFEYAKKLINDGRVLQDSVRTQSVNPFSNMGKRTFDEALIGRQRSIDDASGAAELSNQLASIERELYDFDKLAPERQRKIYNELLQMERQFGLQQGQLTGDYGGQRTLQGQQFDRGIFESDRDYNMNLDRIKRADYESDRDYEFAKTQTEWENMFNSKQFDEGKAARLWEQAFQEKNFAQTVKDEAAARGLQWAGLKQRDKEFIADSVFREKQFKYNQDQDLLKEREKPSAELSAKTSTDNYNVLYDDIASGATKEEARMLLQQNSANLTDSDYKKLNDYINGL